MVVLRGIMRPTSLGKTWAIACEADGNLYVYGANHFKVDESPQKISASVYASLSMRACQHASPGRRCLARRCLSYEPHAYTRAKDRSMWRRLLRVVHPDGGGDGDPVTTIRS